MRVKIYENAEDEALSVFAEVDERHVVVLDQGGELVCVPFEDFGRFVDALESLYAAPPDARPAYGTRAKCRVCKTPITYTHTGWDHDIPAMGEWSITAHHAAAPATPDATTNGGGR